MEHKHRHRAPNGQLGGKGMDFVVGEASPCLYNRCWGANPSLGSRICRQSGASDGYLGALTGVPEVGLTRAVMVTFFFKR